MILTFDDWKLDVDLDATMVRSVHEAADHCNCAYCRNFYAAVDAHYPNLRPFLAEFGLDIEAPDEQMPYDYDNRMYYDSVYLVCGSILQAGTEPILVDGIGIRAENDALVGDRCPQPCFVLDVSNVVLPWVLEEPMQDTLSPANEPPFIKKMWDRLLGKVKNSRDIS